MKKPAFHLWIVLTISYLLVPFALSAQADAGEDQTVCNPSVTLNGSVPQNGTGEWSVFTGSATFDEPTLYNTSAIVAKDTSVLRWTTIDDYGTTFDYVKIINDEVTSDAGADIEVCENFAYLSASPPAPKENGHWAVISGAAVIIDYQDPNSMVSNLSPEANIIGWTVTKGFCLALDIISVYNSSTSPADAGTDIEVCTNTATLSAIAPGVGEGGLWHAISTPEAIIENSSDPVTVVSNLTQGISTFRWTVSNGYCEDSDMVSVHNASTSSADAGNDIEVCTNSAILSAVAPGIGESGLWHAISTPEAIIENSSDPVTVVSNLTQGISTFKWTISNGYCEDSDMVSVNNASPSSAYAGEDQEFYVKTKIFATKPLVGTGEWSVIIGSAKIDGSANYHKANIVACEQGASRIKWTVTNKTALLTCTSSDTVNITNLAQIAYTGGTKLICSDTVRLSGSKQDYPNETGAWTIIEGAGTILNPSLHNTKVIDLTPGESVFRWTVTTHDCIAYADETIKYYLAEADFSTDKTSGCSPLLVEFENNSSGGESYTWDFGNGGQTHDELKNFEWSFTGKTGQDSVYLVQLVAMSESGCKDTSSIEILVLALPEIDFNAYPVTQTYPDTIVNIENLSNESYNSYLWDFGDGTSDNHEEFIQNFSHAYGAPGEYKIKLVSSLAGCNDTIAKNVNILQPTAIASLAQKGVLIYPNPSNGKFLIKFNNSMDYNAIRVSTIHGKLILTKNIATDGGSIDLSGLEGGVYLLTFQGKQKQLKTKVILNK